METDVIIRQVAFDGSQLAVVPTHSQFIVPRQQRPTLKRRGAPTTDEVDGAEWKLRVRQPGTLDRECPAARHREHNGGGDEGAARAVRADRRYRRRLAPQPRREVEAMDKCFVDDASAQS